MEQKEEKNASVIPEAELEASIKVSDHDRKYLKPKEIAAYCMTSLGNAMLGSFVGNNKQVYMMNFMGLTGTQYGLLSSISTAWDALDDPLSGVIIDRMRTRWGRLRPFLIMPIPFWALTAILLYIVPGGFSAGERFAYALIVNIVNGIGNSYLSGWNLLLFNITPNMKERSELVAIQKFVELFNWLPALVPLLVDYLPKLTNNRIVQPQVYTGSSVFFVVIAVAACIYGFYTMRERIPQASKAELKQNSIFTSFKNIVKCKPFLVLVLAGFCNSFNGIRGSAGEDFFWINCMGKLSNRFVASLFTGLPNYITTPMAPKFINKFGERNVSINGSIYQGVMWIVLYILGYSPSTNSTVNFVFVTFMLTVIGLPARIVSVCEPLIKGNLYDYLEYKTGVRNEGIINAVNEYIGKFSSSVIGLMSGAIYDIIKFTPQHDAYGNIVPHSSASVRKGIFGVFTLFPAMSKILYGLVMLLFKIHGKYKEDMLLKLDENRRMKVQVGQGVENAPEEAEGTTE